MSRAHRIGQKETVNIYRRGERGRRVRGRQGAYDRAMKVY